MSRCRKHDIAGLIVGDDANFVVHNGAASFLPLSRYLVEHDIAGLIGSGGKRVIVHTTPTGGPAMLDTVKALDAIMEQFPASVGVPHRRHRPSWSA